MGAFERAEQIERWGATHARCFVEQAPICRGEALGWSECPECGEANPHPRLTAEENAQIIAAIGQNPDRWPGKYPEVRNG